MKKLFALFFAIFMFFVTSYANENVADKVAKSLRLKSYSGYDVSEDNGAVDITYYHDNYVSVVNATSDGYALYYNRLFYDSEKTALPKITKTDAKGNATVFVNDAANDIISQIDLITGEVSYNGNYKVVFYRKEKGIIFDSNYLTVDVDSNTGEILSYTRVFDKDLNFSQFDSVVDYNTVFDKFKLTNGLELRYNKKISGSNVAAYPVYYANPLTYFNAVDSNVIDVRQSITYNNYFDVTSMYEKTNDSQSTGAGVLSVIEIVKNVHQIPELGIDDEYEIEAAKYLKNSNGKYLVVLDFAKEENKISVTVDANTGIVCEFSRNPLTTGELLTGDEIRKNVTAYAEKYLGGYFKEMRLSNIETTDVTVFVYERLVTGIPFKSNGLCIAADKRGNITNISFLWEDIEFPKADNIISKEQAYNSFAEKCKFTLKYYNHNGQYIPVYVLDSSTTGIIDAVTGDALTYDGKVMQPKKHLDYVDLNTHYSKTQALKMADCDIYVSRGNVALGNPIIQKDFLLLISPYLPDGRPIIENFGDLTDGQLEMLYNAFVSAGVLTEEEIDINGYITREAAVSYFMKTLGYGEVAEDYEIFKKHFEDSDDITKNALGYVELARAMGIVSGDGRYFMPKEYLTNGDSLIIIYNYLSRR